MDIKSTARVTFTTTKGPIEIELFAKELPLSCKEFLNNCTSKRYVGLEFVKATSGLIQTSQLDSHTNIKKEKNARLKFNARGAVGLLREESAKFSSASGFFVSLDPPSQYSSEYVFIGNVVGNSIYNVVKIKDSEIQQDSDVLVYPVPITDCIVTEPFFEDLEKERIEEIQKKRKPKKTVKLHYEEDDDYEELGPPKANANFVSEIGQGTVSVEDYNDVPDSKSVIDIPPLTTNSSSPPPPKVTEKSSAPVKDDIEDSGIVEPDSGTEENERKRPKLTRTDSNSSYDSDLDFSQDEVTYEMLCNHEYICE